MGGICTSSHSSGVAWSPGMDPFSLLRETIWWSSLMSDITAMESNGEESYVRRLTSCAFSSVDLWKRLRAGKKDGAAGIRTQGPWLSVPMLCHRATTPTSNHPSILPLCMWPALGMVLIVRRGCCVGKWWSSLMSDITAMESDGEES